MALHYCLYNTDSVFFFSPFSNVQAREEINKLLTDTSSEEESQPGPSKKGRPTDQSKVHCTGLLVLVIM